MSNIRFRQVQHVSLPRPRREGARDEARRFYAGLLELPEIPVPASLDAAELVWFALGDQEIHIFPEPGEWHEPRGQHLCLQLPDEAALGTLRARLTAAGCPVRDTTPIRNRPRFFARDPFGNQLEFAVVLGPYT